MTVTLPPSSFTFTTLSAGITWTQVAPALWSGIQGTEFHGTVEYADYRFIACDQVGAVIGTFDTLEDAQQQVAHPTGRSYLAHHVSTLIPPVPRTLRGRLAALAAAVSAVTAGAVVLMIGTIHP